MAIEQVQTLDRKETKLVGFTVTVSGNQDMEDGIVEKLRSELAGRRHEVAYLVDPTGMYLVQVYTDREWTPDVPIENMVGVEVSDFSDIPEGMIQHTIPAGKFVKVTHTGSEADIAKTYAEISERGLSDNRPFDFEYWNRVDMLQQEESSIDIYLPL